MVKKKRFFNFNICGLIKKGKMKLQYRETLNKANETYSKEKTKIKKRGK